MNIEKAKLSCKNCRWCVEEEEYSYGAKEKFFMCSHEKCSSSHFRCRELAYTFSKAYCFDARGVDGACGIEANLYEDNLKFNKETLYIVRYSYNDAYLFKVCSKDELIAEFKKVSKIKICNENDFNTEYQKFQNDKEFGDRKY